MTEHPRPDLQLLADLDAGLLAPQQAVRVRAAAEADPVGRAVLAALAATRADLAAAGDVPPIPPEAARRWAAAIGPSTPAHTGRRTGDAAPGESRPRETCPTAPRSRGPRPRGARLRAARRVPRRPLLVAAAALVALLGVVLLPTEPTEPAIDLAAAGRAALGATDLGPLADPVRRSGCLRSVAAPGIDPDAPVLGGRRVELAGRSGILLVLPTGRLGTFHTLVVDTGCGPAGGTLLGSAVVGG